MAERVIEKKSFAFAVKVVKTVRELKRETREYQLLGQLIRSGTSIGANVAEARYAQSRKDFLTKHYIALKEANETWYWLRVLKEAGIISGDSIKVLLDDPQELIRILIAIIKTTKEHGI